MCTSYIWASGKSRSYLKVCSTSPSFTCVPGAFWYRFGETWIVGGRTDFVGWRTSTFFSSTFFSGVASYDNWSGVRMLESHSSSCYSISSSECSDWSISCEIIGVSELSWYFTVFIDLFACSSFCGSGSCLLSSVLDCYAFGLGTCHLLKTDFWSPMLEPDWMLCLDSAQG